MMDAVPVPVGPVFPVNLSQKAGDSAVTALVADGSGNFTVVGTALSGVNDVGIWARQFTGGGAVAGPAFPVSTPTQDTPGGAAAAMDAAGDMVVAWTGIQLGDNGVVSERNVYARRFGRDGTPLGPQFIVPTDTEGEQYGPRVAMAADGSFVIGWTSGKPVLQETDVFARRFGPDGTPRGDVFPVNTATAGDQFLSAIKSDDAGDFAAVWYRYDRDTASTEVSAQRFGSDGSRRGDAFQVAIAPSITYPDAAMDAVGNLTVAWPEWRGFQNISVYAQRYDDAGVPSGGRIDVAEYNMGTGSGPGPNLALTSEPDGDLTFAWAGVVAPNAKTASFARRFTAAGEPEGPAFVINDTGVLSQVQAVVATNDHGGFVAAWANRALRSSGLEMQARRFRAAGPAAEVVGRLVFYNHSSFDGNDPAANASDDGAIDSQRTPMTLDVAPPTAAAVTGYTKGINGVMIDVKGLPAVATLTAEDFSFRSGNVWDTRVWTAGPDPVQVTLRRGAGADGSDRITLVWRDYNPLDASPLAQAVANGWLEVTMKANERTALPLPDVFSFGNLIGDTADSNTNFSVTALDLASVKRALNRQTSVATNVLDLDHNGQVNALDLAVVRRSMNHSLPVPNVRGAAVAAEPAGAMAPPPAPEDGVRRVADDVLI